METATLGGGCFWCLEAALRQLRRVESVIDCRTPLEAFFAIHDLTYRVAVVAPKAAKRRRQFASRLKP